MVSQGFPFRNLIVIAHPEIPEAISEADRVVSYFQEEGIQVSNGLLNDESLRDRVISGEFDLIIALGGDGTMLRTGHLSGPCGIPIVGINMGRFGFLMEIRRQQWQEYLPQLLKGQYWLEHRMMLEAQHHRGDEVLGIWDVVNEVVVSRGKYVRPVHLDAYVDGRFLTTYVADGLIAATPTGSTAYAMAAGGPILPPELRTILMVPIAPHLSIDRAIVLAEGSAVSITVHTAHNAVVCVDGQTPVELASEDCVNVRASEHKLKFVRFQDPGYFYRNLTPHMNQNPSRGNLR
jgi:NAD+ kinase